MPNYTTNYNLKKPLGNENLNVEDFNGNSDIIDTEIKTVDSRVSTIIAQSGTSDTEVVDARGTFTVLRDRLDDVDLTLSTLSVDAVDIDITDTGLYFTSENVEGALQEVGLKLGGIEAGAEVNNISDTNATDLTDGGETTLHIHDGRYYTETETNNLLDDKQDELVSGTNLKTINNETLLGSTDIVVATTETYTATIPSASWTGSEAPYTKAVTVTGIASTDNPIIDLVLTGTYATDVAMVEDWAKIYRGVTTANTITFHANEVPSADIAIQAKVVR